MYLNRSCIVALSAAAHWGAASEDRGARVSRVSEVFGVNGRLNEGSVGFFGAGEG